MSLRRRFRILFYWLGGSQVFKCALSEGKLCSTLHFSLPARHAPGQAVLGDSFDNSPPPKTDVDVVALIRNVLPRTICEIKGTLHGLPIGPVLQKSGVCVRARAFVRSCVLACMRACVRAFVRACIGGDCEGAVPR